MRQRREDARNIALIAGSGVLGAVAALVGVSLMGSSVEARDHSAPAWEVTELRPGRFRAEISYSMRERPVELQRVRMSEVRLNQAFFEHSRLFEHSRAVWAEAMAQHEEAVAEATAKHGHQSATRELQVRLQAELAGLQARLEALESSRRDLEGAIVRVSGGESGAAPVIYVDGVRFDGPAENLDPEEIESVEVIKRDAAIAKYGKEGENGVIIIKKKKPGKKRKGGGRR